MDDHRVITRRFWCKHPKGRTKFLHTKIRTAHKNKYNQ